MAIIYKNGIAYGNQRVLDATLTQQGEDADAKAVGDALALKAGTGVIADDFSTSQSYAIGDYTYYNGSLYRFTAAHSAGAWVGTDAQAVQLAEDVVDLKNTFVNDVGDITGSVPLVFSDGYYTTPANGTAVQHVDNADWVCAEADVVAGDTIILKGTGTASNLRLYVFKDSAGKALGRSASSQSGKFTIIAPTDAVKVCINNYLPTTPSDYFAYVGVAVKERVTQLESNFQTLNQLTDFDDITWQEDYIVSSDGSYVESTVASRKYWASNKIFVKGLHKLIFKSIIHYAFYAENGTVVSVSEQATSPQDYEITVPATAVYFSYTKETLYYTYDSSLHGIKGTPELNNDIAVLNDNLGKTQEQITDKFISTANVFNPDTVTDGYYTGDGSIINPESIGGGHSDFISVSPGDVVHFTQVSTFSNSMKGAFFNSNKAWVNPVGDSVVTITVSGNEMYFTVPAGVAFIRMNLIKAYKNVVMCTINNAYPSNYIPYGYYLSDLVYTNDFQSDDYGFLMSCFLKIGAVGDSLSSGAAHATSPTDETVDLYHHSWIQYMARLYGFTGINFSRGGLSTTTWQTNPYGLQKAQETGNECNCYIIGLGANDTKQPESTHLGTESDVGTDADTIYANYDRIITALHAIQPKAKIFCFTLTWLYTETSYASYVRNINTAIRYVVGLHDNCYLIDLEDDPFYYTADVQDNMRGGHYNAIAYNMMAVHIANLIGKYIYDHQDEFRQIEFIGTEYEYNENS